MRALQIYAGPTALAHLQRDGLQPQDIGTVPGAAGGPKGLILGPLDRYIFGEWLARSGQPVHLVGASIGAWRMATACMTDPGAALNRLEHDYIHQHFPLQPGEKRPSAAFVSELFGRNLQAFFEGRIGEVLNHPRYRLHIVTSRGRRLLAREHRWRTPLGYAMAFLANTVNRQALGAWLERVVFSTQQTAMPFDARDYPTHQVNLNAGNFESALQASCSIPFVLQAIHDIADAPSGAYWDGGLTDYHLHLNYSGDPSDEKKGASESMDGPARSIKGLVLYPHFQKAVVPGWLDKGLKWRHRSTPFLDTMVLLAPNPEWVKTLPDGKLPDRTDFTRYGQDLAGRVKAWRAATSASNQLADEFDGWLRRPDMAQVQVL